MARPTAQRKQRESWPIVTWPGRRVRLYFVEGERRDAREVLESRGRSVEVPLGYVLTELIAGRVVTGSQQQQVPHHEREFLELQALLYLAPQYPPYIPSRLRGAFRESQPVKRPRERYREHWREFKRLGRYLSRSGPHTLFAVHRRVRKKMVLDPRPLREKWRKGGLNVPEGSMPLDVYEGRTAVDAAIAELWWCIEHDRTVRWCRACDAPFVLTGRRAHRQQYCAVHRDEGSAARQRVARRDEKDRG